ncbi:hypothetical protein [Desulfurispora thermophila]|uniref:hypothetical protein n=1 Tax=Desulfurispora thermophila TaxID=265470 RepID=UPI00036584D2|nr:hypothetical protein [Desulfurispora thermophila]
MALLFFALGFLLTRLLLPGVLQVITAAGFLRPNYRQENIPLGAGIVFLLNILLATPLLLLWFALARSGPWPGLSAADQKTWLLFLFGATVFTALGLLDDVWGNRETTGLKGHLRQLLAGRLTTGGIKFVFGGSAALIAALLLGGTWWEVVVNTLTIALSVNLINLLDLRPGRAGKGYLLVTALLLPQTWPGLPAQMLLLLTGSLLAYLPADLKARAMLGDTGANLLGSFLGLAAATLPVGAFKYTYLAVLLLLHLIAEKYSFSKIIARSRILSFLDQLGRG